MNIQQQQMKQAPDAPRPLLGLIFWLGLVFVAAALGNLVTTVGDGSWYSQLEKPAWNPPNWVFGPVWTLLYLLMGIAAWLVWKKAGGFAQARNALGLFVLQLGLNSLWSYVFFGMERPDLATGEILVLWAAIAGTMLLFWRWSKSAALMLLPYLLWVSFATALTFSIWQLN